MWYIVGMSTKIYNGYILDVAPDLVSVNKFLQDFAVKAQDIANSIYRNKIAKLAVYVFDHHALGLPPPEDEKSGATILNSSPLGYAHHVVSKQEQDGRSSQYRLDGLDLRCSVVVVPANGKTLALLYCEQKEFTEAWEATPGVREYGYWNNCDEPENVSKKEWNERKEDWTVMTDIGAPAFAGLTKDMVDHFYFSYPMPTSAEVIQPYLDKITPEDRARRFAIDILSNIEFKRIMAEEVAKGPEGDPDGFRIVGRAERIVRKDTELINSKIKEICAQLREINSQILREKIDPATWRVSRKAKSK